MNLRKRLNDLSVQLKNIEDRDGFVCDKEDRAIINVGAENYDDIFSPYCFKGGDTLSLELVDYLWEKQESIPLDYDLTINFNVKNADETKKKEIQSAIKENFENDVHSADQKLHRLLLLSVWFLSFGAVFVTAYLCVIDILPLYATFILEILSWVCVWEGVRALLLDRLTQKLDKLKALRLAAAKIKVTEFEPY